MENCGEYMLVSDYLKNLVYLLYKKKIVKCNIVLHSHQTGTEVIIGVYMFNDVVCNILKSNNCIVQVHVVHNSNAVWLLSNHFMIKISFSCSYTVHCYKILFLFI